MRERQGRPPWWVTSLLGETQRASDSDAWLVVGYPSEPGLPWLTRWAAEADLQIPSELQNNVVFLGVMEGNGKNERFIPKATAFFVGLHTKYGDLLHLVTAEHVIENLGRKHEHVYVRTGIEGFPISKLPLSGWYFHPDAEHTPTDVALTPVGVRGTSISNLLILDPNAFVTRENFTSREWGVGDEIVVIGLFRNHYGREGKNIPVVRIGNLSALPIEPVKTKWGFVEAYLVELHSIGGLSGSPIYIHHPPFRIKHDGSPEVITGPRLNLLGLMQSHFDVSNLREDSVIDDDTEGSINTGIGVVIPAYKIFETLNHPDLQAERDALAARTERDAAKLDIDNESDPSPPDDDANPNHLVDFKRLVDVAARKRPQGD